MRYARKRVIPKCELGVATSLQAAVVAKLSLLLCLLHSIEPGLHNFMVGPHLLPPKPSKHLGKRVRRYRPSHRNRHAPSSRLLAEPD
jgi:hypothetical protein